MDWINIITNVGVPIGCMAALAGYVLKRDKRDEEKDEKHNAQISSLMNAHKDEIRELQSSNASKMEALTDAVNNNTVAMTRLCERLGKGDLL